MGEQVLVVRSDELARALGGKRFQSLPREEIERLHGAVEVFAMDRDLAQRDPSVRRLVACTVAHYNYAWLTWQRSAPHDGSNLGGHSLLVEGPVAAGDEAPVFLDGRAEADARRVLEEAVILPEPPELRLAGLLMDDTEERRGLLGLVHVAKLRRPGAEARAPDHGRIRFTGIGELQQEREHFDVWSRMVVDHLHAF